MAARNLRHDKHMRFTGALMLIFGLADSASARWQRITSADMEILTSAGERTGADVFKRLQAIRGTVEIQTGLANLQSVPVRVWLFGTRSAFSPFRARNEEAGYFRPGSERDHIALYAAGTETARVAAHEYVHLLLHHAGFRLPVWLNEGTAELYSTIALEGSFIRLGEPVSAHLTGLRAHPLLEIEALLAVTDNSPHYNEKSRAGIFYAQSWALVHMLNFSPTYGPRMPEFLSLLLGGADPAFAFEHVWNKTPAAVAKDLKRYVESELRATKTPADGRLSPEQTPKSTRVAELEAELMLNELLAALGRRESALKRLLSLEQTHGSRSEVQAALGDAAAGVGDYSTARDRYERAMALGGGSGALRYHYALALVELKAPEADVLRELERAVSLDRSLFDAQYKLGSRLLQAGRAAEAIEPLRHAAAGRPRNLSSWELLALAYRQSGATEKAVKAAREAGRVARGPEDARRAEGLLRSVESEPDAPAPLQIPVKAAKERVSVEGLLTQVDCIGTKARLRVRHESDRVFLLVRDPGSVVLRNGGSVSAEFRCGAVERRVLVEYNPVADSTYGTAGDVTAIEFR